MTTLKKFIINAFIIIFAFSSIAEEKVSKTSEKEASEEDKK